MGDTAIGYKNNKTLYVGSNASVSGDGSRSRPLNKIQDAIDKAKANDTIYVKDGVYRENLVIDKKIVLSGEEKNKTILNGEKSKDVIQLISDGITIQGFTIKDGNNGINIKSNENIIQDNLITNNNHGILIREKKCNIISKNNISFNTDGVILKYCGYNDICNNVLCENGVAILFHNSHYNHLKNNEVTQNLFCIALVFSSNNLIEHNVIKDNGWKIKNSETISIAGSGNNIVVNNKLFNNRYKKMEIARDKVINHIHNNEIEGKLEKRYFKNINVFASFAPWFSTGLFPPLLILSLPFNQFKDFRKYFRRIGVYLKNDKQSYSNYESILQRKTSRVSNLKDNTNISNKNQKYYSEISKNQTTKDMNILDMIVITPKEFLKQLKPLEAHKNKHNLKTKIITLDEIYESKYFKVKGRDKPEQVKYFIKNSIENWRIKFVMLVGDTKKAPMRITWPAGNDIFLTDLYYADIYEENGKFCSWDSNNNNYFGEFYHNENIDYMTLSPDIGIGRLPCRTKRELKTVVDKIINYENEAYNEEWFNRAILCGGDSSPNYRIPAGEHVCNLADKIISDDFNVIKLYDSKKNLTVKNIINEINKGAGVVLFSGRGNEGMWYTFSSGGKRIGKITTLHNILAIHNRHELPIVFLGTCAAGDLSYINKIFPCFGWSLVTNKNGGAIATIASTQLDFMTVEREEITGSALLLIEFTKALKIGKHLSHVLMKAQKSYLEITGKDYETLVSYNLLGDPSLKIGGYPNNI